jgi:hypothetical protein
MGVSIAQISAMRRLKMAEYDLPPGFDDDDDYDEDEDWDYNDDDDGDYDDYTWDGDDDA